MIVYLKKKASCTCFFSHFVACTGTCSLLGRVGLSHVNNSPRANVLPARVANFGKAMYRSLERSTQDTRGHPGWIFFVQCPGLIFLGKLHWFLYLLLSYFHDPGMFIFCWSSNFVEKVVLNESMTAKMTSRVSYLVYYYCI